MLRAFPKMLIAVIGYNALIFGGGVMGHEANALLARNFPVMVFSGDIWRISLGDGLVALALILLFIEIIKATRTSRREILNHAFSTLTLMAALAEFIAVKGFATSTFFLITLMCLFDVVAGYTVSIVTAKRDLTVAAPGPE
ncbi:MAG TPA: hypothetical protein VH189_13720 [Rhizomicrobium sp.]|jgi:hypothetical protein|nr:hypothetical protein [Rhizomicrobium sp.]